MTLNPSVADDQLGQYYRRTSAIADRLDKSLSFTDAMEALQCLHDGKFRFENGVLILDTPKPVAEPVKFALLADLGIITVPDDYEHAKRLDTFMKRNRKKFYGVNDNITDANFPNPSRVLKPGDKLQVRAFKQIVGGTTSSEERMAFLATQKAVYTGAQGASLVFEEKRNQLPEGYWYVSFDEKDRLWFDGGDRRVPCIDRRSHGDFYWSLGYFENDWSGGSALLCFCDV
ncbi:MAG: hypothetical protein ACREGC_00170 [Minisyncoccia bacterium]